MTGLPLPQVAHHELGMPDTPRSIVKPCVFEDFSQIALGFELLEAQFRERKQAVDDFLGQLLFVANTLRHFGLQAALTGRWTRTSMASSWAIAGEATGNNTNAISAEKRFMISP